MASAWLGSTPIPASLAAASWGVICAAGGLAQAREMGGLTPGPKSVGRGGTRGSIPSGGRTGTTTGPVATWPGMGMPAGIPAGWPAGITGIIGCGVGVGICGPAHWVASCAGVIVARPIGGAGGVGDGMIGVGLGLGAFASAC